MAKDRSLLPVPSPRKVSQKGQKIQKCNLEGAPLQGPGNPAASS
jgi:hypothetical protein